MNRYLLDTHTFIWWVEDSPKLSPAANKIISRLENEFYLSLASAWEMAIKISLGKLKLATSLKRFIRDPFDRLLIAQAMTEKMPIISADTTLEAYTIERIW